MTKTLTLVPCHKQKLNFGLNFIKTWLLYCKNDFAFVFSSEEESIWMQEKAGKCFIPIVLPSEMTVRGNQITTKKMYGLKKMFKKGYSHIGVFDSESALVKKFDTDLVYPEIYDSKIIKCNKSILGGDLIRKCAKVLGVNQNKKLIDETENFTQYWWFNEICVYETKDFNSFYSWLKDKPNYQVIYDDWVCFDYLLYGIYLICEREFRVKKFMKGIEYKYGAIEHNRHDTEGESSEFKSYADRNSYPQLHEHIKVQIQIDR